VSTQRHTVDADGHGKTLGAAVRLATEGLPWRRVNKLVRDGKVTVDGETVRDPATRLSQGAEIVVDPHARPTTLAAAVKLLHVDPHIVVVDKPAGLLSVPWDDERDTLLQIAHAHMRRQLGQRHLPPLRVVQRLDKETSGVMVFARTRTAERHLSGLLRSHDIERRYVALCEGRVTSRSHESYLMADRGDGRRGSFRGSNPPRNAKRSITHVAAKQVFERPGADAVTLVGCTLETGRQHQIRIHLAEAGHPLVGERVYGDLRRRQPVEASRLMLHAEHLGFVHPAHEEVVRWSSPPPPDFQSLVDALTAAARSSS
jgi:23S rRNA pseudouridine1911/1915/1917 synthase